MAIFPTIFSVLFAAATIEPAEENTVLPFATHVLLPIVGLVPDRSPPATRVVPLSEKSSKTMTSALADGPVARSVARKTQDPRDRTVERRVFFMELWFSRVSDWGSSVRNEKTLFIPPDFLIFTDPV